MNTYKVQYLVSGSDWQTAWTVVTAENSIAARQLAESMFGGPSRIKGIY